MRSVRALQKRLARIERASLPQPSPIALAYGSFDHFIERQILPGILAGVLDRTDMIDIVAALRSWEDYCTW